jgi:hypothetical protein
MKKSGLFAELLLKIVLVFVVSVLMSFTYGCAKARSRVFDVSKRGQISKEELRESLDSFEEFGSAIVTQTAIQLDALEPDFKTRKMGLLHRTRFKQAMHTMLDRDDPIEAFIETWALTVRITNYFKDGQGSNLFGKHQDLVITASEKIQAGIEQIGRKFLKEDTFNETRKDISNFANTNPIIGTFSNIIVYATETKPGQPGLFDEVVGIPMSPFKAMSGVDRTASAIYSVGESADKMADVVEELPESAKWQMMLLLMEMKETEVIKSLMDSTSELSDSSARLADSAEKLPEELRQEISILIREIDEKQSNIQITLEKAEKTSIAIERASVELTNTSKAFNNTAGSLNETARQWQGAANSTTETLKEFAKLMGTEKKTTEPAKPFDILEYRDTIETASKTISQVRDLLAEINEFTESEQFAEYAVTPRRVTNLMAWRLGQLIVLIFILALVYRFVVVRVLNKPE